MAITQYYVDPAIAASSGTGTIGDPYGDLQYALNNITQGAGGDQINIKAGTAEVLASALTLATYGTPAEGQTLTLRGYTSTAGDGGIAEINCNGGSMWTSTAYDSIILYDLKIRNGGSSNLVDLDNNCSAINCEVYDTTGQGIKFDLRGLVFGCYVHDTASVGIGMTSQGTIAFNYVQEGVTNKFGNAISVSFGNAILHNVVDLYSSSASNGIQGTGAGGLIHGNTVFAQSGTGNGIRIAADNYVAINNYVEGFSGVGGVGLNVTAGDVVIVTDNVFYNNTTDDSIANSIEETSTSLSASGLVDPANDDFRAKNSLRAGAWPSTFPEVALGNYLDIGAIQRREWTRAPRLQGHGV